MELKGSYTIEAALLMPLILGTIVILIFTSFFLHDRAVIYEGAISLANKYSNEQKLSNDRIKQKLEAESRQVINDKVLCTKNISTQITVSNKEIIVKSQGNFYFPNMYVAQAVFRKQNFDIEVTKKMKRLDPVSFIRNCRKVEKIINRISGGRRLEPRIQEGSE